MADDSTRDPANRNTFLAALPPADRERILALGAVVSVSAGEILHHSHGTIREAWFPIDFVSSLRAVMENGAEAQVAIIGCDGMIGVTALLGGSDMTFNEALVQIGGAGLRVPIERLRQEAARSARLRVLLQRYAQALLVEISQTSACNQFHTIEQRLARCLLALLSRVPGEEIPITHERLALLLGSFRPGVSLAAQRLQEQGIIGYTRGRIRVLDRERLLRIACECYLAVASEYDRLLGADAVQQLQLTADVPGDMLRELNSQLMITAIREQQAREEAEETINLNARFFAMLSHELRTPLTAILGWAELLQMGDFAQETLDVALETIRRNALAQRQLINDMLDLARLRSGRISLEFAQLDLSGAVRDAIASIRPTSDAASVAITAITGDPVTINADSVRVQQILANLLSNAVKFTAPGGSIGVEVANRQSHVEVTVRDSGRGIEPELLPHVFEHYRQGPAGPSGELGMGLGLAIVQHLVTLHGGTVHVQSAGTGNGTTFTVVLPKA